MPVFFTPQQANAVLPEVDETVRRVITIKQATENAPENEMTESMVKLEREMQKLEDLGVC